MGTKGQPQPGSAKPLGMVVPRPQGSDQQWDAVTMPRAWPAAPEAAAGPAMAEGHRGQHAHLHLTVPSARLQHLPGLC